MKDNEFKVSIVTICYNNAEEIRATIESVIEQTYKNIEYIIIDGASDDGSVDIIKEYSDQIAVFISEPDKNLYDAINKGLRKATGDIVGLIHAGDRLFNDKVIEKIASHFRNNNIDAMYGHSYLVNKDDVPVRVNKSPEFSRGLIKRGWMPSHQSIYIRRELLDRYGFYNIELHPSSDYEFFLRYFYFKKIKVKRLDEFIVRFRMGGMSTKNYMNNLKAQKIQKEFWKMNGENAPFYFVPFKLARKIIQFLRAFKYRLLKSYVK